MARKAGDDLGLLTEILVALGLVAVLLIAVFVYQYRKGVQHSRYKQRAGTAQAVIQSTQQVGGNELQALVQLRIRLDRDAEQGGSASMTVKIAVPLVKLPHYQKGCTVPTQYDGSQKIIIGGLMGKVV